MYNTNSWSLSYNGLARQSVIRVFAAFAFQTDRQNVTTLFDIAEIVSGMHEIINIKILNIKY